MKYRKPKILLRDIPIVTWFALAIAVVTVGGIISIANQGRNEKAPLQARAMKVFQYDKSHPNVMPAGTVRALSISIAFSDTAGALKILSQLEPIADRDI